MCIGVGEGETRLVIKIYSRGFLGDSVMENPSANVRITGSIPGAGGSHMPENS